MPKHNDKHLQLEKLLIQKQARYHELYDLCRDSEVIVPFDRPVQNGWTRRFRVRADVLRSSEGEKYQAMLPFVQHEIWSRNHDFIDRNGAWTWGQRIDKKLAHKLRVIAFEFWEKTALPDDWKLKYFRKSCIGSHSWGTYTHLDWGWGIARQHVFEAYVVPHYVTHYKIINGHYESERAKLDEWMEQHNAWDRICHLKGCRCKSDWRLEGLASKKKARRLWDEQAILDALQVEVP